MFYVSVALHSSTDLNGEEVPMSKPVRHRNKWRIRWFDADGHRRSKTFSTYRDAEKALAMYQVEAERISVGLSPKPAPKKTFDDLCDYWLEHRTTRKKNSKDDRSVINASLRPHFKGMDLSEVTLEDVDRFRRLRCPNEHDTKLTASERRRRGIISVKTLHNHLTVLISMFNLAVDLGWLDSKPNIKKPRLIRADFSYIRSQDDIQKFLVAAADEDEGVFELYYTATYTGMRAGELSGLQWGDVSLSRRLITVQRSYDSTTKTDEIRYVPILDVLLPVLRAWKVRCPSSMWVFPNKVGHMHQPSSRVFQETLQRVRERAGIPYRFRFHDFRHTFASHWMMAGGDIYRLQKILGHKSIQMTERYAHLSPDVWTEDYGIFEELPLQDAATVQLPR